MVKNIFKKVKDGCKKFKQAVSATTMAIVNAVVFAYILCPIPVYADPKGNTSYLNPINNLKTVALALVGAFGGVIFIYGIVKFAESFQKKDQNGEYAALYTIGAGAIMAGGSIIIGILQG